MKKYLFILLFIVSFNNIIPNDSIDSVSTINSEYTDNEIIYESYEIYIRRLNIFVTITLALFGFFVAVNIFSGKKTLDNAKDELNKIQEIVKEYQSSIKSFESEKENIFEEIKEFNEEQINYHIHNFMSNSIKNELLSLIDAENPDEEKIFQKLSEIINSPDNMSIHIYSKCLHKYGHNSDILHICKNGLEYYYNYYNK